MATLPVAFTDVVLHADQGIDYDITLCDPGGRVTVVALHGGALAPRTAELAEALAGDEYNLYAFVARDDRPALRISPLRAREPRLDTLIDRSMFVLSIDADTDSESRVRVGGRNAPLQALLLESLAAAGFEALASETPGIETSSAYFFNRAGEGGIELALSAALRESLYSGEGCDARRALFVASVRESVQRFVQGARSDLARTMERFEQTTARISPEVRSGPGRREPGDRERNEGQP
ncbi:MAG: poly-gamma-glutamate hydrolase family protein [Anaerolineae bacterium]